MTRQHKMIDVSLHLRVPADATMASLRALLERIAQAENMELNTGNGFPFHAEMTVPLEAITMLREAA